jgi:Ferritin-like domain
VVTDGEGASRRALLGRAGAGLAGIGALVVAGCGGGGTATAGQTATTTPASPAAAAQDVAILSRALELERRTVDAYVAGIPLLPRPLAQAARQFLSEEIEHTGELISLLKTSGAKAGPRANSYPLGHPATAAEVIALLHTLETMQLAYYTEWIPRLSPGPTRAGAATILTVDSQHVTLLRLTQGQTPVPSAFVSGSE